MACCISHLGEFSQPMFALVGFLTGSLQRPTATAERLCRLLASSRTSKNVLIAAVSKGCGLMLATGGIAADRRVRAGG
jgi:hypothetical protein